MLVILIRVLGDAGYVVDFGDIKAVVRKLCKALNECFLCPAQSDVLTISVISDVLHIKCQDGAEFSFPASDAAMLPIKHSTVEELAKYFVSAVRGLPARPVCIVPVVVLC